MDRIRNFAIIAHVDHGKSTLADRLMEITGRIKTTGHSDQMLDSHPISRERGITIKLAPVTMSYILDSKSYILNLIDTPGHVDFSYEVERSLAACEGAILLVDATQGVQAQTLSHLQKAKKLGIIIIPVINKVDLPNARVEETENQLRKLLEVGSELIKSPNESRAVASADEELFSQRASDDILKISAKSGLGINKLLEKIVLKIPSPQSIPNSPTRALVFSSLYDPRRGVIAFIRIFDGRITSKDKTYFLATKTEGSIIEIGHFIPNMSPSNELRTGEVGYIMTNLKDPNLVKIGDTITIDSPAISNCVPLPGYREPKPMVFISLFPVDQNDYYLLEDALKKLKLNDAAITFSPASSKALGRGFRCGFLGHLHAEVSQERLEQDYNLNVISTQPTVEYINPAISNSYEEPWVLATLFTPNIYVGAVIFLCEDRRGILKDMVHQGENVMLKYELPLSEIITDFFDQLKSKTSGFGSIDYDLLEYRSFEAVNLEILLNHESIDAFSQIMEKSRAEKFGRFLVERLKEILPRQQIPVIIQAAVNNQIIARADLAAFRKDVIAKLYGGDRSRKDKLLEAQRKGKKKMKQIGKIEIPSDTFLKLFKT